MPELIITSLLLGVGLAMDACAVSMANGLKEPTMKVRKVLLVAFFFGLFQGLMPLIGYIVGSSFLTKIEWIIPWLALVLLGFIGGKMIYDGVNDDEVVECCHTLTLKLLFIQAIATSIDALSVGVSISNYKLDYALICVSIIALVTLLICFGAVFIGKKFGTKLGNKAEILGGIILIAIGIEIFITGLL
jgi:putative Mn2+ efflux pump MntP